MPRRTTEVYCVYTSTPIDAGSPHHRVTRYRNTQGKYTLNRTAAQLFTVLEDALELARQVPPAFGWAGVELFVPTGTSSDPKPEVE